MPPVPHSTDCLIIGGGVIGLSLANELAGQGITVRVLERGQPGREASWAGAGILPPGSWFSPHPQVEQLAALSRQQHATLSAQLLEATGIDDQYEQCGAWYALTSDSSSAAIDHLRERLSAWEKIGFSSRWLEPAEVATLEPELTPTAAYLVPSEAQVRNPRRLEALRLSCESRGVLIESHTELIGFDIEAGEIQAAKSTTATGTSAMGTTAKGTTQVFTAGQFCLATGAWTESIGQQLGLSLPTTPIRGQMVLLRAAQRRLGRIVHLNGKYLVPRRDGRVLVGSTVEEAGFDTSTNAQDIDELVAFAHGQAPYLAQAEVETSWAGLRPASGDDLPMIGPLPRLSNGWITAGHFRSGLQFAPATAVVVAQLLSGQQPSIDLAAFDPARFSTAAASV